MRQGGANLGAYWARAEHSLLERRKQPLLRPDFRHIGGYFAQVRTGSVALRDGLPVRARPLLVLAAPAAAEVSSGWVGIAKMTGFGLVSPLPGIWPSLHLDTAITLPIGVEAYAAYALRAWLSQDQSISDRTRRFAKWSAIFSALGMAGQVAYHLLTQAGVSRAPCGRVNPNWIHS